MLVPDELEPVLVEEAAVREAEDPLPHHLEDVVRAVVDEGHIVLTDVREEFT